MATWEGTPPERYSVVTGFFPETSPKETWATNPRPLLVCGTAQHPETKEFFCRIAYGTKNLNEGRAHRDDLVIANLSILNQLGLKHPTRFVIGRGSDMLILPWTSEFFQPWTGCATPVLSQLPDNIQRHVGHVLASLLDLPKF